MASVLADEKIEVRGTRPIQGPMSPFNRDYLNAKHASGHSLELPSGMAPAMPPVRVRFFDPVVLPEDPCLLVTASYLLPVALEKDPGYPGWEESVDWFRASVIHDRRTARESVVLSLAGERGGDEERITMSLLDRLPGTATAGRARLSRALARIRQDGRGAVIIDFDDDHVAR